MFAYKSIECLYQLLKSRHLIVRSNSLNPYDISNLEIWNHEKKEGNSIVLAYIADISVSINPSYICEHCRYKRNFVL